MSIFSNPFFSVAGQLERGSNVLQTLKAAVTGQGVRSNTGVATVDKVLSTAASNPFVTAGVGAVAAGPATALKAAQAGFGALPTGGKVAAVVAAPVVVGAVAANPNLISQAAQTPKALSQFGGNVGTLIKDPSLSNAKQVIEDNPVISAGVAAAGALAVGRGVSGLIASGLNTAAVKENTQAALGALPSNPVSSVPRNLETAITSLTPAEDAGPSSLPLTPETQVLGREVKTASVVKPRRRKAATRAPDVRVNVLNQNTYIDGRT